MPELDDRSPASESRRQELPRRRFVAGDLPSLMRSAPGRRELVGSAHRTLRPVLVPIATAYRRTVLRRLRTTAVVGSLGKTTATRALRAVFEVGVPHKVPANNESRIALDLLGLHPKVERRIYECGIERPGRMAQFARMVRPDTVVVTAIASEHIRSFVTLETTRHEKAEMVRALRPSGTCVLNMDDENVRWMASQTQARVVTYGYDAGADLRGEHVEVIGTSETRLTFAIDGVTRTARLRLVGRVAAYAALAALAAAWAEGLDLDLAVHALEGLPPAAGRLEPMEIDGGVTVLCDDHKAPLESVEAALDVLADVSARRRIAVLGGILDSNLTTDATYRRLGAALTAVDRVFFLGRRRDFRPLRSEAVRAGLPTSKIVRLQGDVFADAAAVGDDLRSGDVLLLKGRDSHQLQRIALILAGRNVQCDRDPCNLRTRCAECPLLTRPA